MNHDKLVELRRKVALSCRIIGARGLAPSTFGHVSVRVPGSDEVLIRAKGPNETGLEFATSADVLRIDLDGKPMEQAAGLVPPGETPMHLALYRKRPEVTSVIHCHPLWVAVLTACEKPLVPMFGGFDGQAGLRLLEEGIPVYPRSVTVKNDQLAMELVEVMGESQACLLRGHGMTVVGDSVETATETCLNLNQLAYANYLAYAIGAPLPVPDIEEHRARFANAGGKRERRGANADGPSLWRYNRALLESEGRTDAAVTQ